MNKLIARDGARRVDTTPACTQKRCQEGRKACPCPDACELPLDDEADDLTETAKAIIFAAICALALICAVAPAFV